MIVVGGGILDIDVTDTLTVDGFIQANSLDVASSGEDRGTGGSGGSIYIRTGNFTGTSSSL